MPVILRRSSIKADYGIPNSTQYRLIKEGLWPTPVPLGLRAVGWLEREVTAVIDARAAGKSDDEIRALVAKLLSSRHIPDQNPHQVIKKDCSDTTQPHPNNELQSIPNAQQWRTV